MKLGIGTAAALRKSVQKEIYTGGTTTVNGAGAHVALMLFEGPKPDDALCQTLMADHSTNTAPAASATKYVSIKALHDTFKEQLLSILTLRGKWREFEQKEQDVVMGVVSAQSELTSSVQEGSQRESFFLNKAGNASWFILAVLDPRLTPARADLVSPYTSMQFCVHAYIGSVGVPGSGADLELRTLEVKADSNSGDYILQVGDFILKYGTAPAQENVSQPPGPSTVIAGHSQDGFFGEIPSADLITYEQLVDLTGITQQLKTPDIHKWLKFVVDGTVMYMAKTPFASSIMQGTLHNASIIDGNKILKIKGRKYRIKLATAPDIRRTLFRLASSEAYLGPNANYWADIDKVELGSSYTVHLGPVIASGAKPTTSYGTLAGFNNTIGPTSLNVNMAWRPVLELID